MASSVVSAVVEGLLGSWVPCFTLIGLASATFFTLKLSLSLWKGFKTYVLSRALGLHVNFRQMGKWAVITGATDGIGKEYAENLAKKGLSVLLISRTQTKLDAVAKEIEEKYKAETRTICFDFSQGMDKYGKLKEELDGMDIGVLVNNVGTSHEGEFFHEVEDLEQVMQNIINMNILACTMMTKIVLPGMLEKMKGVVINISSASGRNPVPMLAMYSASKAYMDFFTRALTQEYRDKGIIFQCVMPFWVLTNMLPKDWKPSVTCPNAKDFVSSAIATVGVQDRTHGFPGHEVQGYVLSMVTDSQLWSLFKPTFLHERKIRLDKKQKEKLG